MNILIKNEKAIEKLVKNFSNETEFALNLMQIFSDTPKVNKKEICCNGKLIRIKEYDVCIDCGQCFECYNFVPESKYNGGYTIRKKYRYNFLTHLRKILYQTPEIKSTLHNYIFRNFKIMFEVFSDNKDRRKKNFYNYKFIINRLLDLISEEFTFKELKGKIAKNQHWKFWNSVKNLIVTHKNDFL